MDVFLLTSRSEGVATATLEAMASGVPVVAFNVGSVSDVIVDGVTGLLCPARDVTAMADAVISVLSNTDLARTLSANARRFVMERCSASECAASHERAFGCALSR